MKFSPLRFICLISHYLTESQNTFCLYFSFHLMGISFFSGLNNVWLHIMSFQWLGLKQATACYGVYNYFFKAIFCNVNVLLVKRNKSFNFNHTFWPKCSLTLLLIRFPQCFIITCSCVKRKLHVLRTLLRLLSNNSFTIFRGLQWRVFCCLRTCNVSVC